MKTLFNKRIPIENLLVLCILLLASCSEPPQQYRQALETDNLSKAQKLVNNGLTSKEHIIIEHKRGNLSKHSIIDLTIRMRSDNADQYLELFLDQELTEREIKGITRIFFRKHRFELIEKLSDKYKDKMIFNGEIAELINHPEFPTHYEFLIRHNITNSEQLLSAIKHSKGSSRDSNLPKLLDLYVRVHGKEKNVEFERHLSYFCRQPEWRQRLLSYISTGKLDLSTTANAQSEFLKNTKDKTELRLAISQGMKFNQNLKSSSSSRSQALMTPIYWIAKNFGNETALAAFEAKSVKMKHIAPYTLTSLGFAPDLLKQHGIDLNMDSGLALKNALKRKDFAYMNKLVDSGADPLLLGSKLFSSGSEMTAFRKKALPLIKHRLNESHYHLLDHAIKTGDIYAVELLMANGLYPYDRYIEDALDSKNSKTELIQAMAKHHPSTLFSDRGVAYLTFSNQGDELRKILFENISKIPPHPSWLVIAVKNGNIELVKKLLDAGIDPNWRFEYTVPLLLAFNSNTSEAIRHLLLDHGANPFYNYYYNKTPVQKIKPDRLEEILPPMLDRSRKVLGDQSSQFVTFAKASANSSYSRVPFSKMLYDYNPNSEAIKAYYGEKWWKYVKARKLGESLSSHGMTFRFIPAGKIKVGDKTIQIDTPFFITESEVTWKQFSSFSRRKPQTGQDPDKPVTGLSASDMKQFFSGRKWTLPTSDEWEYACRAGSTSLFHGKANDVLWSITNARREIQKVKQKKANKWQLFDMHGNVMEVCEDRDSYVARGGSAYQSPAKCSAKSFVKINADDTKPDLGFRLVIRPPVPPPTE